MGCPIGNIYTLGYAFGCNRRNFDGDGCNDSDGMEKERLNAYWVQLFVLSGLLYGLGWLIPPFRTFASGGYWLGIIIGFGALSAFLMRWVNRAASGSGHRFVSAVQGSTGVKLLVTMATLLAYILSGGGERVAFSMGLFGVYMLHTAHFVWYLQRIAKAKP